MSDSRGESPQEQLDFGEWHRAAWDEVREFLQTSAEEYYGPDNPQHRLAKEMFETFLERRPSEAATKALSSAFAMWGNLRGASERAQAAAEQISLEEDVWDQVDHGLFRSFCQDDRKKKGMQLLEDLVDRVVPLKSRSALLSRLARSWLDDGKTGRARRAFEQIVAWDSSEWHIDGARGHLHELDNLNIGQEAPHFSLADIDGRPVMLSEHKGKVVVLHFWGTSCGGCQFIFPSLRKIAQEHSDEVVLIGFSNDTDLDKLRAKIADEEFTWPQVCDCRGWQEAAFKLYNASGIPREYVIDRAGRIAIKLSGGSLWPRPIYRRAIALCIPLLVLTLFLWVEGQQHYLLLLSVALPSTVLGLWLRSGPFSIQRLRVPLGAWAGFLFMMYFFLAPSFISRISTEVGNSRIGRFDVSLLDGTVLSSEDIEGSVVLLDFWTSWCVPCIAQMPDMVTIQEKYKDRDDFMLIAMNRGEDHQTVQRFVKRHPYTFPVGIDTTGHLSDFFEASPIPQSILIGKNGGLRLRHVGRDGAEDIVAVLSNHIDELLAE